MNKSSNKLLSTFQFVYLTSQKYPRDFKEHLICYNTVFRDLKQIKGEYSKKIKKYKFAIKIQL